MPPAAISHAMIAPKTPVAVANGRGSDQMPAPTIEPTTIMVSANSENFCVCTAATGTVVGAPITASRLSIATSSHRQQNRAYDLRLCSVYAVDLYLLFISADLE